LGGIEEISGSLPEFHLELKFKAQNLSRLKSAWAFSPGIHFRVKICLKTETHLAKYNGLSNFQNIVTIISSKEFARNFLMHLQTYNNLRFICLQRKETKPMHTILVVDDEEPVALSIELSLRRDYQVRVANSATDALKIIRRSPPDLIILDIIMPGMDGIQFCNELRKDPLFKSIPILFLTAKGRIEDKIAGLEAGADDYLTKPFDVRELQLRVKAILRRVDETQPAESTPEELRVGDLVLNCQNYQITAGEKTVLLTPVEFDLMYHLMSHPNQVFSGERLLRELWDYPSDTGSPDLVRMHIRNLRLKIEPDSRNPKYILTIPRHGYTIADK